MKNKSFSLQIIFLPIFFTILSICVITFYNIHTLTQNTKIRIQNIESKYILEQKSKIYKKIHLLKDSILFQERKIEDTVKKKLKERVSNANSIAQSLYTKYKDIKSIDEIKEIIKTTLSSLSYDDKNSYLFILDKNTKTSIIHPIKKYRNVNMYNFKDSRGAYIYREHEKLMEKHNEAYLKIYFNKPSIENKEFPKINYMQNFKPFDWIIGTGEYIDTTEKKVKNLLLEKFYSMPKDSNYLFIYELHNISGGKDFASVIFSQSRPDLVGKMISDNLKDKQGKYVRKELLEKLRVKDDAYIKYWYKKPSHTTIHPKLTYFYHFKNWNWILASGFYFDDLNEDIRNIKKEIEQKKKDIIISSVLVAIVLSIVISIISYLLSSKINTTISEFIDQLSRSKDKLKHAQHIAKLGSWKYIPKTKTLLWSDEVYSILDLEISNDDKNYKRLLEQTPIEEHQLIIDNYNTLSIKDKQTFEHTILVKDGLKYVREKTNPIFDKDENLLYIVGTIQDITNEVTKQQEIDKKEQLLYQQSKMAAMGEMIGNIAHQWRQPLSLISTVASGIQLHLEYDILNKKEAINDLNKLEQSVQYLSTTIDDFKNFLHPQNTIDEKFNIQDVLEKNFFMFGKSFKNNNIEFILNLNDVSISGNKNELLQVIINILNNAKDALINQNIDNKYIFVDLIQNDKHAILTIKDNAGGIDKNIINKIFDAYFTTKHNNYGTGLGLYMSYQIITNSFNGKIIAYNDTYRYKNNDYTGATFVITIPIN